MATASFEVATYDVRLSRQLDIHVDGNSVSFHATITCRGAEHTLIVYFLTESSFVPNNAFHANQKKGTIYLPREQYQWYVDLLRNERPVHCLLNSRYPNQNSIYTGAEPIGEAE